MDFNGLRLREVLISFCVALFALVPAVAAIDPVTSPRYIGQTAGDIDQWQRIAFRSEHPLRSTAQIKVAIQTRAQACRASSAFPAHPHPTLTLARV